MAFGPALEDTSAAGLWAVLVVPSTLARTELSLYHTLREVSRGPFALTCVGLFFFAETD